MGEPRSNQKKTDATVPQIPAEVVAGFLSGEKEPKPRRFEVRLSENQAIALQYVADQLGITPSEVMRRSVFASERLSQMVTRREWEMAGDYVGYRNAVLDLKAEIVRIHIDMNRIGSNLNQIAKRANSGSPPTRQIMQGYEREFKKLNERFEGIEAKVERLLESYEDLTPFEGE